MTLARLANLSSVITQAKVILNTSSLSRFSKDDVNLLKKKLTHLEDEFLMQVLKFSITDEEKPPVLEVSGMVATSPRKVPTKKLEIAVDKKGKIKTSIGTDKHGTITVSAPQDEIEKTPETTPLKTTVTTTEKGMVAVKAPVEPPADNELRQRLLEEKKKLAAKKKK
jgi:hypothetical protein